MGIRHNRPAELGDNEPIFVFDQRMDDTLGMDDHVDFLSKGISKSHGPR